MPPATAEDLNDLAIALHPVVIMAPDAEGECTTPSPGALAGPPDDAACCVSTETNPEAKPVRRLAAVARGAGSVSKSPPRCPPVEATGRDGTAYAGNLLHSVVVYRCLRARQMGGRPLGPKDTERMLALEGRLRPEAVSMRDDGRATRQFLRWETNAIAGVSVRTCERQGTDIGVPVDTVDLGAGGICVMTELTMQPGDRVELTIQGVGDDDAGRTVRFASRVAWARGRRVGLMFAGGPQWD